MKKGSTNQCLGINITTEVYVGFKMWLCGKQQHLPVRIVSTGTCFYFIFHLGFFCENGKTDRWKEDRQIHDTIWSGKTEKMSI